MKKVVLLFIMLAACVYGVLAQQAITVRGKVSNAAGGALAGVTIREKTTNRSTVTKNNGSYEISSPANGQLIFTFVGYKSLEKGVANQRENNVTLQEEDRSLEQVVVIGYGTQKRKDLTGAISSVKGEELAKVPVQNVAQALQGRLAGVQVAMNDGSPGAEPSIKIRGGTSISQSNQPLYVVDGVPQTDGLAFLDPMDIESIDVLKDASAAAIYGARGANGVVLVTTKQVRVGKVSINYDGYAGAKKVTDELPVLNAYQYLLLEYERSLSDAIKLEQFTKRYGTYDSLSYYYGNNPGFNWQKEVFGKSVWNQYHKISMNGGTRESKFNLFLARNKDEGVMLNSASAKNIGKLTLTQKVGEKLTVNAIVNYSNQKINGLSPAEGGNARLSMLQNMLQYRPVAGRTSAEDEALMDYEIDPLDDQTNPALQSPILTIKTRPRERVINILNASATAQYNFTKNLIYRGLVGYTVRDNKYKQFNEAQSILAFRNAGAFGSISQAKDTRFNYSNTLSYNKTFNEIHKLDVTAGQEYLYNYSESFGTGARQFPTVNNGWNDLSMGTLLEAPVSLAEEDKLLSFFGRVNYGFKDRYLFTATLRADGSSKFGANNRWGYFPSAAFAWRVIEEEFMKKATAFSDLKLRLSYGQAGNNRIANYSALSIYGTGYYPLNDKIVNSAYRNNLPNPDLKWEANESVNIGVDMGFFKQRITLSAELYDNRSKNLLFNTRIPSSSGFTTQFQNIGNTSSRGLELTLNTINVKNEQLNWSTNLNIAFNKTKVLGLSNDEKSKVLNSYSTYNDFILQVGQPVGVMYGYLADGLYQVGDFNFDATNNTYTLKQDAVQDNRAVQPGYAKFKDISGPDGVPDGRITDADRTIIGNANPKYSGGINNTVSYKGLDLSVFLNFAVGNDIYNANVLNNSSPTGFLNTLDIFNSNIRWMTINAAGQRVTDPTELENLNKGKTMPSYLGGPGRQHSGVIEDGSFLRINNISLGYTLPKAWVQKAKLSNVRVYVTAYNLHVFTKYTGYDPEVSVVNNGGLTPGVDFSAYPRAKSFIVGLNVSL
ncbi:MAG: SusC/RagA family TonB-linked outer membrane protein [Sphingobacterium sp.]